MLKMLGILCILTGSCGIGFTMAAELDARIRELLQLQKLTIRLRNEIRYMHRTLPDAFAVLAGGSGTPFREFFGAVSARLRGGSGQTAEEIWKESMEKYLSVLHLAGQDLAELEKLGGMLGCLDVEMQLNALDYYLDQLMQSEQRAEQAAEKQKRLYRYLGILSGAVLTILII